MIDFLKRSGPCYCKWGSEWQRLPMKEMPKTRQTKKLMKILWTRTAGGGATAVNIVGDGIISVKAVVERGCWRGEDG